MDKSTLSNYGWVVIVTLVLAVMLALATPFGIFIGENTKNTLYSFIQTNETATDLETLSPAIVEMQPMATMINPMMKQYVTKALTPNYIYAKSPKAETTEEAFIQQKNVTYVGTPKGKYWATGDIVTIYKNGFLLGDYYVIVLGDVIELMDTKTGDGTVDVLDAAEAALVLGNHTDFTGAFQMAADVNGDGIYTKDGDFELICNIAVSGKEFYDQAYNYCTGGIIPDYIDEITAKYNLKYYNTITTAIEDVNNGTVGLNSVSQDSNETDVCVYIDSQNIPNIVVLEDILLNKRLTVTNDVIINLNGKNLKFQNDVTAIEVKNINNTSQIVNLKINGKIEGSSIEIHNDNAACIVTTANTHAIISNGSYTAHSSATNVDANYLAPNGSKYQTRGFSCAKNSCITASNVNINTSTDNGNSYGIYNAGTLVVSDSTIYSDAKYSDDGTNYIYLSVGIYSNNSTTINNCNITGTHSSVQSNGILYVDGGEYQSVGHGGIYISGNGKTSYIKNATMKAIEYNGQYEVKPESANNVGFYVGGNVGQDNLTVYVDNCTFYGTRAPFALRGSSGEKNNVIYISNSNINSDAKIRIDNDTHTLYIGKGNNFTADNTTRPARCVVTEEVYNT